MARYSGAIWRGPVPNETPGGEIAHLGLVLHIQQGTEAGTDFWFHNPASQVSAHFGNPKAGQLEQWVDTADRAWAEVAGNPYWVSIENEGNSGDSLTASQFENIAELLAWLHTVYDVPLQISDNPAGGIGGLTGHGLGGAAWGGHTDCPGRPILDERPLIIARAAQIAGAPTPGGTMGDIALSGGYRNEWPDLADFLALKFPPGQTVSAEVDAEWANFGSRAAAEYARQALAAVKALAAHITTPPPVDVDALAAALAPKLAAGTPLDAASITALASEVAHAAVMHLADALKAGAVATATG